MDWIVVLLISSTGFWAGYAVRDSQSRRRRAKLGMTPPPDILPLASLRDRVMALFAKRPSRPEPSSQSKQL